MQFQKRCANVGNCIGDEIWKILAEVVGKSLGKNHHKFSILEKFRKA
jgi:hypothetical protein